MGLLFEVWEWLREQAQPKKVAHFRSEEVLPFEVAAGVSFINILRVNFSCESLFKARL